MTTRPYLLKIPCVVCHTTFPAKTPRALYCSVHRVLVRKLQTAEHKMRKRAEKVVE